MLPVVVHGKRHIKVGMVDEFRQHYNDYASFMAKLPGIRACHAFADKEDPQAYWHVLFAKDAKAFDTARSMIVQEAAYARLASTYAALDEEGELLLPPYVTAVTDADSRAHPRMREMMKRSSQDVLNVYGSWSDAAAFWIEPSVRHVRRKPLAGYIRAEATTLPGPPLLGFTRRHVLPGRMEELAASFQALCNLWHEKVPGILAASVHREPEAPNVVHDLRIFANHEAFQAHVDKSDAQLTAAIETWFANYDTSVPFTGQLYYPSSSASDEGLRTSSVRDRPVRVGFDEFAYGQDGMLGPLPDMTKGC